ncbi:MAG: hypothetical protein WC184_05040 [Acidimicrobiia bacterium]
MGHYVAMLGVAIIVLVLVVGIPLGVIWGGAAAALVLGWFLRDDALARHEGSELIETNI